MQQVIDDIDAGAPLVYPDIGQHKPNIIGNLSMVDEDSQPQNDTDGDVYALDQPFVVQRKKSPKERITGLKGSPLKKSPKNKSPIRRSPRKKSATPRRSSP